jgi:hypothetical protein
MTSQSTPGSGNDFVVDLFLRNVHALTERLHGMRLGTGAGVDEAPWSDGQIRIPRAFSPDRIDYDRRFIRATLAHFAPGAPSGRVVAVPTDEARVIHANGIRNHDRYRLYLAMLRAGEPVPPIFVELRGSRYHILDGNHRTHAARDAGVTSLVGMIV